MSARWQSPSQAPSLPRRPGTEAGSSGGGTDSTLSGSLEGTLRGQGHLGTWP